MEQPHFHFSFSKWEGMWWRGEKNFLCIFIQDVVCVKPCPTPWTWAAWLAFREFIKTQSLVYGNMGILDGGEVEFSPLGNLLQRKTPHPPKPEGHHVLTLLLIWWIRGTQPMRRRGIVLRSLFAHALLFPASKKCALTLPEKKAWLNASLTFALTTPKGNLPQSISSML